ncbi:MAG: hypothetical protein ACK2UK_12180 [Candidatus Promineifilaceae bacterium]
MSEPITVEATIGRNGRVWVKRVKLKNGWQVVEQGRQWHDEAGRHILIRIPGGQVQEILLSTISLRWELRPRRTPPQII